MVLSVWIAKKCIRRVERNMPKNSNSHQPNQSRYQAFATEICHANSSYLVSICNFGITYVLWVVAASECIGSKASLVGVVFRP